MTLGAFLAEAGTRRRVPGEWDCGTFPAAWAMANGFADPMAEWRGAYADDDRAREVMAAAGGLRAMFEKGLRAVGVEPLDLEIDDLPPGAVGVVRVLGHEAGGVYAGAGKWALVAPRGLVFAPFVGGQVLGAWGIHG